MSISAGAVQFSLKGSGTNAELRITCFDEDIPLESEGSASLAITMVVNLKLVEEFFEREGVRMAGAVLGYGLAIALAVIAILEVGVLRLQPDGLLRVLLDFYLAKMIRLTIKLKKLHPLVEFLA